MQLHLDNLVSPFLPATNPAGTFGSVSSSGSYPGPGESCRLKQIGTGPDSLVPHLTVRGDGVFIPAQGGFTAVGSVPHSFHINEVPLNTRPITVLLPPQRNGLADTSEMLCTYQVVCNEVLCFYGLELRHASSLVEVARQD